MTELREPAKVFSQAGDQPVAIMNRNQVVGYFIPVEAIDSPDAENVTTQQLNAVLQRRRPAVDSVLKYLEDK